MSENDSPRNGSQDSILAGQVLSIPVTSTEKPHFESLIKASLVALRKRRYLLHKGSTYEVSEDQVEPSVKAELESLDNRIAVCQRIIAHMQ